MVERSSENRIFGFSDDLFTSLRDTETVFCFGGRKRELWYIADNLTFDTAAYLASSFPLAPSFPRRRESSPIRTETYRAKRFPQFRILDSRLRGNDGSGKQRIGVS
ncbi:PilS cassette [Morococcus cerebrosus]|uniref:PilS cassette n=1 Tax=Morococcus cerebrosus TaxID=1056807 RepID=A0A0C1EIL5_9NEIS|nr:PilS cassette [Morococcus cerebrosus]